MACKSKQIARITAVILFLVTVFGIIRIPSFFGVAADTAVFKRSELSYESYINEYGKFKSGSDTVVIPANAYVLGEGTINLNAESLETGDDSSVTWNFAIQSEGLYQLEIDYFPTVSRGGSIERTILIDNKIPFSEAAFVEFTRIYVDGEITQNTKGNDVNPDQIETPRRLTFSLCDPEGFVPGKLSLYLSSGEHSITLLANKEKLEIFELRFIPSVREISYKEYLAAHKSVADNNAETICVEAENMTEKSSFTIYPVSDKSSAATYPQDPVKTRLNVISGSKWGKVGQWITWTVDVKSDGFYKIAPRYKQDSYYGGFVSRSLKIDGEVPFSEAENIRFDYSTAYSVKPLGDDNGPFSIFLSAGKHTISLQVVIGDMSSVIKGVKEALTALNADYRRILMITGPSPDIYRDYG